ncbi:hypothetical protein ACHAXT_004720 [Thalassiosira profunda]
MSHAHALYAAAKPRVEVEVPHSSYQVDFQAVNCGKLVPSSKRRIRFKFGYSNAEALDAGETGQDCRGSEHEVSITWSLSSGKQSVAFDGREVYFDVGDSTQTKLSHAWKDGNGHTLQVKIHAANYSTKANPDPDWKQYDLLVDGHSFFKLPKIFEIGIKAKDVPADGYKLQPKFAQYGGGSRFAEEAPQEPEPEPVMDLLSFDDFDASAPAPAVQAPPQQAAAPQPPVQPGFAQLPAQNYAPPTQMPPQAAYVAPEAPPAQPNYAPPAQAPAPIYQAPAQTNAPPAQYQQTYAPTNPFTSAQAQTQGQYNCVSPNNSPNETMVQDATQPAPTSYAAPAPTMADVQQANPVTPTGASTALVPVATASTSYGVDKSLVNLDDLFGTAAAPATEASVNAKVEAANAQKSLGQLQESKKPVMNAFNPAPAYQPQQMQQYSQQPQGYAQQQQQYANYGYPQQQYAQQQQPGFAYQ